MTDDERAAPPPDKVDIGRSTKRRRADASAAASQPQIGQALRSVYDQTVSEAIPDEMLDLLGRLG